MIFQTISLLPYEEATLTAICVSNSTELNQSPRRALIVCPGGGYRFRSDREREPIAMKFLGEGFQTFILDYTVKEGAKDYLPLRQAALAVKHVRDHASEYNIDPDYVFVCGFSAGGHLAASVGILWNIPELSDITGDRPEGYCRPTGMILSYPVITAGGFSHQSSIRYLCGHENPTDEERDRFSLEKHVSAATPPAFIWHTFEDSTVPVQNSLMLASAMTDAGVPFELHIFPTGHHGLALSNEVTASGKIEKNIIPHNACWIDLAIRWAQDLK